jgi:hypothetical protein
VPTQTDSAPIGVDEEDEMTRHAWTVLFAVIGILATAATGSAQEPAAAPFDTLVERIRIGQSIWVTDQAGREVRGTLERLTNNGLVLKADGLEAFAAPDIRRVRARQSDSVKNGALIGLGIGGTLGTAWCIGAAADDSGDIDARVECAEGLIGFPGLGALIGMAVDAAIPGRVHVVYEAPRRGVASRMSVTVCPLFSSRAKGLALSFAF